MSTVAEAKITTRSNPATISEGHYLSELQFYKVLRNDGLQTTVVNDRGLEFTITNNIVAEGSYTVDQYTEEKLVTRTELIEIFKSAYGAAFKVHFLKMPKEKDIKEVVKGFNSTDGFLLVKEMQKRITEAFKGTPRTLIGHMIVPEHSAGRSLVMDLEKQFEPGARPEACYSQVDHRTLEWLIFKNVKYIAKAPATRTRKS